MYDQPFSVTEPRCSCDTEMRYFCPVHVKFIERCKHCQLRIFSYNGAPQTWRHAEGDQAGKNRCAIDPYGYDAAPADEPCSFACNGYVPNPPRGFMYKDIP